VSTAWLSLGSNQSPADNLAGQHYLGITDKFTTTSSLVVMLEHPDRSTLIAAAEELAELVRDDARLNPLVRNIRVSMDRDFLESWGLLLADTEELEDQLRLLAEPNLLPFLRSLNDTLEDKLADGSEEVERGSGEDELVRTMTGFELFARDLYAALDDNALDAAPVAAALVDDLVFGDRYLVDAQGTTLLMTVSPTFDLGDRRKLSDMTERTRTVSAAVAGRHPGLRVSLTGDVAGEADEEQALGADAFIPSLLAFGAIFILLAFSFRRLRAILFTLLALAAFFFTLLTWQGVSFWKRIAPTLERRMQVLLHAGRIVIILDPKTPGNPVNILQPDRMFNPGERVVNGLMESVGGAAPQLQSVATAGALQAAIEHERRWQEPNPNAGIPLPDTRPRIEVIDGNSRQVGSLIDEVEQKVLQG